ncbi:MAG: hypothetical protein ACE5HF_01295 [Gemmatimonadota bacterium]
MRHEGTSRDRRRGPRASAATLLCLGLAAAVAPGRLAAQPFSTGGTRAASPRPAIGLEPTRLVIETGLQARLGILADGLVHEIVLCLEGEVRGDTVRASRFTMPEPRVSAPRFALFLPCPSRTLAVWHNHPLQLPIREAATGSSRRPRREPVTDPLRLCRLSERDLETASRLPYPFVVVAVNADTWCWWSRRQIRSLDRAPVLPPGGQLFASPASGR